MSEIEVRLALAERALEEMKHRARNDRQVTTLLEAELDQARLEIAAIKSKMYAGISVAVGLAPIFSWALRVLA